MNTIFSTISGKFVRLPNEEGSSDQRTRQWTNFFCHLNRACVGHLSVDYLDPFLPLLLANFGASNEFLDVRYQLSLPVYISWRVVKSISIGFYKQDGEEHTVPKLLFGEGLRGK